MGSNLPCKSCQVPHDNSQFPRPLSDFLRIDFSIHSVSFYISVSGCADMEPILPDAADADSPLKADELQVLRAQYEKEGYYVGVQTKFNYAWVNLYAVVDHPQRVDRMCRG